MERWYWVELIGFDNQAPDFGVSAYLARNQSTTGISLLFAHVDVLFHTGEELLPTACSYYAHEYNRERRRQNWTKTQLHGLVATLQSHGVKVFFSCFDRSDLITDPAYLAFGKSGKPSRYLCAVKPLASGTVGDVIIERLRFVIEEYGFDGLQLADGLSSARASIENGDFSLSLCRRSGIAIPQRLMGDGEECYVARRAWILKNRRFAWIKFLADAWAEFYQKLFDTVKKPILYNVAWARGPFEALYRYGLDYGRCCIDSAFAVMVEENSATRAITAAEDEGGVEHTLLHRDRFAYEYTLMQSEIKLHTCGLRQISLMPISDTLEQWDALRHCPSELTRSIVRRYNSFVWHAGRFVPLCDAPLYCLADGISGEDWQWLAKQEGYRLPPVDFVEGFVGVYNPDALYAEVERFCKKKGYYGAAITEELVVSGLQVGAQVSLCDLPAFNRAKALLVTNLNAYTPAQKQLLARAKLPILAVGEDVELPLEKSDYYKGKKLSVALYNAACAPALSVLSVHDRICRARPCQHGEIWTEPLSYPRVIPAFFEALAEMMNAAFAIDRTAPGVKLASYLCQNERYVVLSNDLHTYCLATVHCGGRVTAAQALMKDRGYTVKCEGNCFTVRIPPRGAEIVKTENNETI